MPVAVEKAGATYYLAYDQVGTLRAVADSSGNVIKEITYDSFGYVLNDTNPAFEIPFGFAGGLYDRDTGLVRFGFRDYDPDTGRWTAKDPIGFAGGDSDLYGYCIDDPVNGIDPEGLYSWLDFGDDAANFSAGFGDTITFGATAWIRDQWNDKVWGDEFDSVDPCSDSYTAGKWSGYAWEATTIGIGSAPKGWLLGRGRGLLNANDYIRLGWSWKGSAKEGKEIIRLAIGNKRLPIHWHFP
jgi:RHS repeat-associated protein